MCLSSAVSCMPNRHVECAWCGCGIYRQDTTFPSFFRSMGQVRDEAGVGPMVHMVLPKGGRVLTLLVARQESTLKRQGVDIVALCCSTVCQGQLETAWAEQHAETLALN
jgi:hypothetical protein